MSSEQVKQLQSQPRFTCCNIRYEGPSLSDANYEKGTLLPAGTPVEILSIGRRAVTFRAGGTEFTLKQEYGTNEAFEQYLEKVLTTTDPRPRIASLPVNVQEAIHLGNVEKGMTRDEVILTLGYPPTHRTEKLDAPEWLYWQNRFATFRIQFGPDGNVSGFVGGNVPGGTDPVRKVK